MAESALRNLIPSARDRILSQQGQMPSAPMPQETFRGRAFNTMYDMFGGNSDEPARRAQATRRAEGLLGAGRFAADMTPVVGDALAIDEAREAYRQGNMGQAAILGGLTMLGMVPLAGDAASRAIRSELDMSQGARMLRAEEQGYTGPFYHGSQRIDRVVETGQIDPRRATSGPMPYFTDSPELASSYAKGKADTSLPEGGYKDFFKVQPKDIGASGRLPITVEQSWNLLDSKTKDEIRNKASRVGYEDLEEFTGGLTLHPAGIDASPSKSQYDYLMRTSARGNPLAALRELWVDGGNLFNEEEKLAEIYRLAGFPARIDQSSAPWIEASGLLPAMLRMENPLVTTNTSEITEKVIPALEDAFKNSRARTRQYGADSWDKNVRYTPKEWISQLREDVSKNENSFVWTSIPDKVTEALKNLGYDGIIDSGGKMGGVPHRVAIPFRPDQVRSVNAAFDPAKRNSANLLATAAGGTISLSALRQLMPQEERPIQ